VSFEIVAMTLPSRYRRGSLALVCGAIAALVMCGMAETAGARSVALVPYCAGSGVNATNPVPDCIFRPYAYPKQAVATTGTATVTKEPTRVGTSWNYEFTVTVHYTVPYKLCSVATSPCQEYTPGVGKEGVAFAIDGAYVPGAKTFEDVSPNPVSSDCPEVSGGGTCVETFEMNTYSIWGHFVLVVGMNIGYSVPYDWDGNVLGASKFETAISVTFPKLKGSSPVQEIP
jgi:hypothetical protein